MDDIIIYIYIVISIFRFASIFLNGPFGDHHLWTGLLTCSHFEANKNWGFPTGLTLKNMDALEDLKKCNMKVLSSQNINMEPFHITQLKRIIIFHPPPFLASMLDFGSVGLFLVSSFLID